MKEKRNFFLLTDPTAKTTTTGIAAPMKEAQRDEATRMRTVDEAQLQGASKPLLTYVLVIIRIHLFATLLVSGNDDMSFGNVVFREYYHSREVQSSVLWEKGICIFISTTERFINDGHILYGLLVVAMELSASLLVIIDLPDAIIGHLTFFFFFIGHRTCMLQCHRRSRRRSRTAEQDKRRD